MAYPYIKYPQRCASPLTLKIRKFALYQLATLQRKGKVILSEIKSQESFLLQEVINTNLN